MSRFDPLFPACDCDECGRRNGDIERGCMQMCSPDPCRRRETYYCGYSGASCDDTSIRMRLFDKCRCERRDRRQLAPAAPPVTIVNPWNCRERACVTLSIDECGNLVVCVKR